MDGWIKRKRLTDLGDILVKHLGVPHHDMPTKSMLKNFMNSVSAELPLEVVVYISIL